MCRYNTFLLFYKYGWLIHQELFWLDIGFQDLFGHTLVVRPTNQFLRSTKQIFFYPLLSRDQLLMPHDFCIPLMCQAYIIHK